MPPKRRRRFQGLYYHSSPPKVLPMNDQLPNQNSRRRRDVDEFSVKLSSIRIWMHEKDIGKLTRILWAGQGNRLRQQASTNPRVKRFLAAVPYVMNAIKEVHQAVIDNTLETLQSKLEPPVPPALVTGKDANGLNIIHKAAGLGHTKILEYLISIWPEGINETDITGKTPLHWAASAKNNMRCYTLLTQAGCDEEAVDYKGKTPSYYRHKPNEIERAFLVYVPDAPRVSPDIITDWDALSEDTNSDKKSDIKIPLTNGITERTNDDSTNEENLSEADINDGVSANDENEMLKKDDNKENVDENLNGKDIETGNETAPSTATEPGTPSAEENHDENEKLEDDDNNGNEINKVNDVDEKGEENEVDNAAAADRDNAIENDVEEVVKETPIEIEKNIDKEKFNITSEIQNEDLKEETESKKEESNAPENMQDQMQNETELLEELKLDDENEKVNEVNENYADDVNKISETENGKQIAISEVDKLQKEQVKNLTEDEIVEHNIKNETKENNENFDEIEKTENEIAAVKEEVCDNRNEASDNINENTIIQNGIKNDDLSNEIEQNKGNGTLKQDQETGEKNCVVENEDVNEKQKKPDQRSENDDKSEESDTEKEEVVETKANAKPTDEKSADDDDDDEDDEDVVVPGEDKNNIDRSETESERDEHEPDEGKNNEHIQSADKLDENHNNGSITSSLAIEGFVQGNSEDNTVQSQSAALIDEESRIQEIISSGDMEQLAQIVLNGDGNKLLGMQSPETDIQAFLNNVPNYMSKIRRVHEAAREGSLLSLQQALDRRKFAIAKDEISPNGATPLHVAVIFGHSDIVRYLAARFPETTTITDNDGRIALHYAAVIKDNGHFYNMLTQLGSNPKTKDKLGHTPEFYFDTENSSEVLTYRELLSNFGAEDLEAELLSDQGEAESQSFQSNPIFKTEQGKYLAKTLAEPLIEALTEIANKRPEDPISYLTGYLQSYMRTRSSNAGGPSSSSKTSSTAIVNSNNVDNRRMNGNLRNTTVTNNDEIGVDESDDLLTPQTDDRDEHGQSMLHFACARSHRRGGLLHLIEESNIDITYRDELYRTARDVSLQANQPANAKEIDRYLLSLAVVGDLKPFEHFALSGYDHIIDITDDNEKNIIDVVAERGHEELAEFLGSLRALEELREELHQMIRDNKVERVKEIINSSDSKWLLNAKNYYGRTALHIAVLKESEEIVELFVDLHSETIRIGDNLERTPLHYAMGTNAIESLSRILINKGAKRTTKDLKGRQPSYYFMNKADVLRLQEEEDENR